MKQFRVCADAFCVALVLCLVVAPLARADDVAEFYRKKTINFFIGSAPGGGYDTYGRIVVRYMGQYVPGAPDVLPRNMPGGSSRVAASHIYNVAPKDGLAIGMINQELPLSQAMGEAFKFDNGKFNWIGTPDYDNRVVVTWSTTNVRTIDDAKRRDVTMGASGPIEASGYPEMLNSLLGTRFKSIRGYNGGAAINLAMERGEVDGRADNAWNSYKGDHPDWVRDGKINILLQVGLAKDPDLPDVPLLMDLAANPDDHEALRLISTSSSLGHPIIAPPGVPKERIDALRHAFDMAMNDPRLLADAKTQRRPIVPVSGQTLERYVADVLAAPAPVVRRATALIEAK